MSRLYTPLSEGKIFEFPKSLDIKGIKQTEIENSFNQEKIEREVRSYLILHSFSDRKESTFIPDDWTVSMIVWVIKHVNDLLRYKDWISLMELWVWEWVIVKYFLSNYSDKINKIVWLDICSGAIDDASDNLKSVIDINPEKVELKVSNLLKNYNSQIIDKLDFVYACLPQVRYIGSEEDRAKIKDFYAHYYENKWFEHLEYDKYGLWLIEQTIIEASLSTRNSDILLNLAWRVSKEVLFDLFYKYWYSPEIMYEKIIPQHEWTELWMYVNLEKDWLCIPEFFEDTEWMKTISAEVAEKRRKEKQPVFHKIFVIKWVSNTYSV